jgi:hypothetical protein
MSEVIQKDLVVAIQDMGAAGLTSSSFEMASKGQVGMELNLDKIPLRDSSITPEEILLSESQERMLMVVEPSKLKEIEIVFAHWGLDAAVVGTILPNRLVRLTWKGEVLTELDPDLLVERAPRYERAFSPWKWKNQTSSTLEKSSFTLPLNCLKRLITKMNPGFWVEISIFSCQEKVTLTSAHCNARSIKKTVSCNNLLIVILLFHYPARSMGINLLYGSPIFPTTPKLRDLIALLIISSLANILEN